MKKKSAVSVLGALAVLCTGGGILTACDGENLVLPPFDYDYTKPVEDFGDGIKIDGALDEDAWKGQKTFTTTIRNTNVVYRITSYFGEKGAYFAFDIDDDAVYFNETRDIYNNSGVEFCVGSPDNTQITYEIDLNAGGKRMLRKYTGAPYTNWFSELHSAVATKGGAVNTAECTGYVAEIYLPYALFNADGSDTPLEKLLVNPSIIRANSAASVTYEDRLWYCIGIEERGLGYAPAAANWYGFGGEGLVCDSVTLSSSAGGAITGKDYVIKDDSYELSVLPDAGYYLEKLTLNGKDVTDGLTYSGGKAVYKFTGSGDAELQATFAPLSETKFTLTGSVSAEDGGALSNISMFAAYGGTVTPISADAEGAYTASLPEAEYDIYCEADGYLTNVERVNLFGDGSKNILLRKSFLGSHTVIGSASKDESWDFTLLGQGTAISKDNGWLVAANHTTLMGTKMFVSGNIVLSMREGSDRRAGFRFVDQSGNGIFVCLLAENENAKNKYSMQLIGLGTNSHWSGRDLDDATVRVLANGDGVPFAALCENGKVTVWVNGVKIVDNFADTKLSASTEVIPGIVTCSGGEFRNLNFNTTGFEGGYPVSISTTGRGAVTCDKQTYQAGDTLTFTVTPREGYAVNGITVNGADAFATLSGNTFTVEAGNLTSVTVSVSFVRVEGEDGVLSGTIVCDGQAVTDEISLTLANSEGTEYTLKSTDGTFDFGKVALGVWTLTATGADYLDYKQVITVTGTAQIQIELSHITMQDKYVKAGGNQYNVEAIESEKKVVFTGVNEEPLVLNIAAKANEDVYLSAVIRKQNTFTMGAEGGIRYGFAFVGATRTLNFNYAYFTDPGAYMASLVDWGVVDVSKAFSASQIAAWESDAGLRIAAARIGGRFYLFAEEDGVMKVMASGAHAELSQSVINLGFKTWWQTAGAEYTDIQYKVGSIPLDVTRSGGENGTVEVSANPVLGGTVTVTLTPDSGYVVSAFTVNGQNKISALVKSGESSVFTLANYTDSKNLVIETAFALKTEFNVTLALSGVANGTEITLKGTNTYTGSVSGGKVSFNGILGGTYSVEADGYHSADIAITEDGEIPVTLVKITMKDKWVTEGGELYDVEAFESDKKIVYTGTEGSGTQSFGVTLNIQAKANEDIYVSAVIRNQNTFEITNDGRYGFKFVGEGRSLNCDYAYWGVHNVTLVDWGVFNDQAAPLSAKQVAAYQGAGLRIAAARIGGKFYMFAEEDGVMKVMTSAEHGPLSNAVINVGFETWWQAKGAEYADIEYKVGSIPLDVTKSGGSNGTVEVSANPVLGGTVTVTLTPDSGYVVSAFTVNGQNKISSLVKSGESSVLTLENYTDSKNIIVAAQFELKAEVEVTLGIKLHKYGIGTGNLADIPDGVSVVLRGANTYEQVSANGSVTFGEVVKGTYTVEVDGYVAKTYAVNAAADEDITLEYDLIESTADIDTTDANNGNVELNINSNGEVLFKQEIKANEDFYVSAVFKNVEKDANSLRFGFWIGRDNNDDGNITGIWGDDAETGELGERIFAPLCYQWYQGNREYVMQFIPGWNGHFMDDAAATAMDGGDGIRLGLARVNGNFFMLREIGGEIKIIAHFKDAGYAGRFAEQNIRVGISTMGAETTQKANFAELQLEAVTKGTPFADEKHQNGIVKGTAHYDNVMVVATAETAFKTDFNSVYQYEVDADLSGFGENNGTLSWSSTSAETVYFKQNMTNLTLEYTVKATIPQRGRVTAFAIFDGAGPYVCSISHEVNGDGSSNGYHLQLIQHWNWDGGIYAQLTPTQMTKMQTEGLAMRIVRTGSTVEWYVDDCSQDTVNLVKAAERPYTNTLGSTGCGIGVAGSAAEFTGITLSGVS